MTHKELVKRWEQYTDGALTHCELAMFVLEMALTEHNRVSWATRALALAYRLINFANNRLLDGR